MNDKMGVSIAPDLSSAIMSIEFGSVPAKADHAHWYKIGHSEACVAAAALASAAPVEALTDEEILIIAAETKHGWSGGELGQIIPFGIEEGESEPYINFARAIEARIKGGAK